MKTVTLFRAKVRALYVCFDSVCMNNLVTLRIISDLETRASSLSTFVRVSILREKDRLDSSTARINIFGRRSIESFGGSPRVDYQHKSRGSH